MALSYFKSLFSEVANKHAPLKKFKVKGRENPWFSDKLSDIIHKRDVAWARARKSKSELDWIHFRQLRNKCTSHIRNAKSNYYVNQMTENSNNPSKFWKAVKDMSMGIG